jgi:hypothetical protein
MAGPGAAYLSAQTGPPATMSRAETAKPPSLECGAEHLVLLISSAPFVCLYHGLTLAI